VVGRRRITELGIRETCVYLFIQIEMLSLRPPVFLLFTS
jgi:hypothetical protein